MSRDADIIRWILRRDRQRFAEGTPGYKEASRALAFVLDLERLRAQGVAWCTEIEFEALVNLATDVKQATKTLAEGQSLASELMAAMSRGHEHEIDETLDALVSVLSGRSLDEPQQGRDPSAAVEDSASRPCGSSNLTPADNQPGQKTA